MSSGNLLFVSKLNDGYVFMYVYCLMYKRKTTCNGPSLRTLYKGGLNSLWDLPVKTWVDERSSWGPRKREHKSQK